MKIAIAFNREQRAELQTLFRLVPPMPEETDPLGKLVVQTFTFEVSAAAIEGNK